jgi:hypothetical protein
MVISLVLFSALLWVAVTLTILSAIDRSERKARRQQKRADRAGGRGADYRPNAPGGHTRSRRLRAH